MKKFYIFLAAALMSVSAFAQRDNVPDDRVLGQYYTTGQVCACFYVPDEMACNTMVMTGTFNNWSSDAANCAELSPVKGYEGWYVTGFDAIVDETQPYYGVQAKPLILSPDGEFNWSYQVSAATVIRGDVQVVTGNFEGEVDLHNYGTSAPNVLVINAWRNNPCSATSHQYTVTVISDGCDGTAVPFIIGSMNGWNFVQMELNAEKTERYGGVPTYEFVFDAIEGTEYQIVSAVRDETGNVTNPEWTEEAYIQELVNGEWQRIYGGTNFQTGKEDNILFDLRQDNLRWARCDGVDAEAVTVRVKMPAGTPEAVEIIGDFDAWTGQPMTLDAASGEWVATVTAKPNHVFKFREAGTWKNELLYLLVSDNEWYTFQSDLVFGQLWSDVTTAAGSVNKAISLDFSDPTMYRWINPTEEIVYKITYDGQNMGSIEGPFEAKANEVIIIEAQPYQGCEFVSWADGSTDNPRKLEVTGDTEVKAIFRYIITGTCGKDNALNWTFNPSLMALNISGKGELTDNYDYAPMIKAVTIGNDITAVGNQAFYFFYNLTAVIIGSSVQTLGMGAFAGSPLEMITCYSQLPPDASADYVFDGASEKLIVYVPADYLEAYKKDAVWGAFDVRPMGAVTVTAEVVETVEVASTESTAAVTWPAVENAVTYEVVVRDKDNNVICTITFNAQGQLTSVEFAAPTREQQDIEINGFTFTIVGLDSNTEYNVTITAKDDQGGVLDERTQPFITGELPTAVDNATVTTAVQKILRDGIVLILRNGKTYTVQGQEVR